MWNKCFPNWKNGIIPSNPQISLFQNESVLVLDDNISITFVKTNIGRYPILHIDKD